MPDTTPPGTPSSNHWASTLAVCFAWTALLAVFFYFFNALSTVLLGFLAAATVAVTLRPLLRYIPGPRGVAAAVVGLALIGCVALLVCSFSYPLAKPIKRELAQWPNTRQSLNNFLAKLNSRLGFPDQPTAEELRAAQKLAAVQQGLPDERALTLDQRQAIATGLRAANHLSVERITQGLGRYLAGQGGQQLFSRSADMTLGILMWLIFIFIGSIFLLADAQGTLLEPVLSLFATQRRARLRAMLDELGPNLRRWFLGTLLSMGIVFCTSLCGYLLIGLSLAVPLAIVAALCEIVPTVGPAVSAGIACVFAAATGTYTTVMGVLCVYGAVQMSEDYIVLPLIMRNAVRIAPVVTLFTVVLWGEIFGVPGLMLAIPINLTLWHAAKHFIAPQKPVSASAPI